MGEIVFRRILPRKAVLAETNYGSFLFLPGLVLLKGDFGRFLQAFITLNDFSGQLLSVNWEMELRHNKT